MSALFVHGFDCHKCRKFTPGRHVLRDWCGINPLFEWALYREKIDEIRCSHCQAKFCSFKDIKLPETIETILNQLIEDQHFRLVHLRGSTADCVYDGKPSICLINLGDHAVRCNLVFSAARTDDGSSSIEMDQESLFDASVWEEEPDEVVDSTLRMLNSHSAVKMDVLQKRHRRSGRAVLTEVCESPPVPGAKDKAQRIWIRVDVTVLWPIDSDRQEG